MALLADCETYRQFTEIEICHWLFVAAQTCNALSRRVEFDGKFRFPQKSVSYPAATVSRDSGSIPGDAQIFVTIFFFFILRAFFNCKTRT